MKILTMSKLQFDNFMRYNNIDDSNVETSHWFFISLNGANDRFGSTDVKSYFKRQHSNVMIMHFGDYSEEFVYRVEHYGPTGLFNDYKANKLYNFIKANKDKKMAIVHCGAGISRSGAVGTFIFDIYGDITYEEFKRKNPHILPNGHILKLLNKQRLNDNES